MLLLLSLTCLFGRMAGERERERERERVKDLGGDIKVTHNFSRR